MYSTLLLLYYILDATNVLYILDATIVCYYGVAYDVAYVPVIRYSNNHLFNDERQNMHTICVSMATTVRLRLMHAISFFHT